MSVFLTYNMGYWLIKLFLICLVKSLRLSFLCSLQLALCSYQTNIFFKGQNPTQTPTCFSEEEKHTYSVIDWYCGACFKKLIFAIFQISIYMYAACCKPEVSPVCCWRDVCAFIDLFIIWKQSLPIYKTWAMTLENTSQKILTLSTAN